MSVESAIINALTPIVTVVEPIIYNGKEKEYIVFNYDEIPAHAESTAYALKMLVQVHLFMPFKKNPNTIKRQIADALQAAEFTYPSITNASDSEGQHYVFECEYAQAVTHIEPTVGEDESSGNV